VVVSHGVGFSGCGVFVMEAGEFYLRSGLIADNTLLDVDGGGVYNCGVFVMDGVLFRVIL
jgi:hypothetical protein